MSRIVLLALAGTAIVAGCASPLEKEVPDTTPENPTAVLETHIVSDGIKGFLPFDGTTRSWTRADMHREDTTFKGTGTFTKYLVGTNDSARIERLDRKVVWTLDPKEKTYIECPLKGCAGPVAERPRTKAAEPAPEKEKVPECAMQVASSTFTVKPTGKKQVINGFDTEQFQVSWLITLQDPKARRTVSTLSVDLWTTPLTPALREATAVEQAYAKALALEIVGIVAPPDQTQVVPAEAGRMIDAYLSQMLGTKEKSAFLKAGKELEKVKGYPVLTVLTWDMRGDACAEQQAAADADGSSARASIPTSAGDVLSSVTDYFVKKKTDETIKEAAGKPILSFTTEVRSHRLEGVRDSKFAPPAGFRKVDRK